MKKKIEDKIKEREKKNEKIVQKAMKELGINKKKSDNLSEEEWYKVNDFLLKKKKDLKKHDYFILNDYGVNENIFSFKNIKDWDYDNWVFQKEAGTLVRDNYDQLYMTDTWFRARPKEELRNKREFIYGNLVSARGYILDKVYEKLEESIERKYPCIYVRKYGTPMFQKIKNSKYSTFSETEKRCAGKEKERSDLDKKLISIYKNIEDTIIQNLKPYEGYTFKETPDKQYDMYNYIIGGFEAAENISFKTFFKDFQEKEQPVQVLKNIAENVYRKYKKILKV